ncbi:hypothetical protein VTL71DRAFT_12745 [Oculimacula yallundae]|uniref:Uncharacterized protein n=1 Tax=Oculimacula yallundae TaxID=86028 RepID=A0ABR4CNG5_9HELO
MMRMMMSEVGETPIEKTELAVLEPEQNICVSSKRPKLIPSCKIIAPYPPVQCLAMISYLNPILSVQMLIVMPDSMMMMRQRMNCVSVLLMTQ